MSISVSPFRVLERGDFWYIQIEHLPLVRSDMNERPASSENHFWLKKDVAKILKDCHEKKDSTKIKTFSSSAVSFKHSKLF
jgi:hypothetical protein